MSASDGTAHPLSLKVMRVSRPSLASHWQPFFSSSPSFSAHSTANVLSLQGSEPLEGHPKTLRDLTNAGQMLMLPAAFGAIQLGETFSCCLCVNNETVVDVDAVSVKVEMQTETTKITLAEFGGPDNVMNAKDTMETVVNHEIKQLGQHVLACSVTYRTPPGMRPVTSGSENANDRFMQTFRKFYKFAVTNPLSVKTKVHVPQSPSALLSRTERDKIFLEVHIQNLTQGPLWFEKINLEPVDGWDVEDANISQGSLTGDAEQALFSGNMALMQPQDMRQYIYIMSPVVASSSSVVTVRPAPGTIIPLGRLDICWRSSIGEPGRLLTSILSRRIPLPPPPPPSVPPVSALPPYLQKSALPGSPSRPRSPSLQQQQHPPQRPGSPLKRTTTPGLPARPQSPVKNAPLPPLPDVPPRADIETDIIVLETPPKATVHIEEPFSLRCALAVSALLPNSASELIETISRKVRILKLAVQHISPTPTRPPPIRTSKGTTSTLSLDHTPIPSPRSSSIDAFTPRQLMSPPGTGTPGGPNYSVASPERMMSPTAVAARSVGSFGIGGLAERLKSVAVNETRGTDGIDAQAESAGLLGVDEGVRLPPPYSATLSTTALTKGGATGKVPFAGSSTTFLPPLTIRAPDTSETADAASNAPERGEELIEFTLSFFPLSRGFARVGGLRVLLLEDSEDYESTPKSVDGDEITLHARDGEIGLSEARTLKEWDILAEVWVK